MSEKKFNAGVKEYRQNYWMPDYVPLDTDILACFKITPQAGVDREEEIGRASCRERVSPYV